MKSATKQAIVYVRGRALGILGAATTTGTFSSGGIGFGAILFILGGLATIVQPAASSILDHAGGRPRPMLPDPVYALRMMSLLVPLLIALTACATTAASSPPGRRDADCCDRQWHADRDGTVP